MPREYKPYSHENKEYESNVNKWRVAMGMTVNELAEECGTSQHMISSLNNGMATPFLMRDQGDKIRGSIRPCVEKMVNILGVPLDELFPRYVCDIDRNNAKILTECQSVGLSIGSESYFMANNQLKYPNKIFVRGILKLLKKKRPRTFNVLMMRFFKEYTLDEVAEEIGVSKERVRQIEASGFRWIRRNFRV